MRHPLPFFLSTLTLAISMAGTSSVLAAEDSDVQEITVYGTYTVGDIIDTATGLGLTLSETPQSVSIMTEQRIQDQALDTIAEVVLNTVGVSTNEVDNVRNTFNARGFEINNYQIEGVPLAWSLAGDQGETIADAVIYERIEVVRGSTGLLTGAGDPSASINLVRKHADSRDFEGYIDVGTGSWSNRQVAVDLANRLNQEGTVRGRVVAKIEKGESYTDFFEEDREVLYGVFEADLSDKTLVRLGTSYQHNDPTAPTWGALPSWYDDGSKTDWSRSKSSAADWTEWETENLNFFASAIHNFENGWQLAINYNRIENDQTTRLLYLFGIVNESNGTGLSSYPYRSKGESKQDSVDIQLKGDFDFLNQTHEFVLGALSSDQNSLTNTFAALEFADPGNFNTWDGSFAEPGWSPTSTIEVDLNTKQSGIYGATRLSFSDSLKVIVGGRISDWEKTGISYGTYPDFGDNGVFVPYLGTLYDLNEQHRLYASYTEIFKPQDARDRAGSFIDPLEGSNKEIGLKSSFLDDALRTSLAYFVIEQDNLAQPDPGFNIPGTIFPASKAAKGTESKGFEVEVVGQPVQGWNIVLGYTKFEAEDASGAEVSTDQPRKQFKLFTTYDMSPTVAGLIIGGGLNWQSEIYSDSINPITMTADKLSQDDYALFSLMARYEVNPQLALQLNIENLTDEKYYNQVGFFDQYRYGAPRHFSMSANWQF